MIMQLGSATGPSLYQAERLQIQSNQDENTYEQNQMFNGENIKMSVNRASTICGHVNIVIQQ
jgi:hypothetical protein